MDVSIIIVNYNTTALTLQCVNSIIEHTKNLDYEIIVVDNASMDKTIYGLKQKFPDVHLLLNKNNEGFGRANNLAMEMAKGEFVFLLNSDAYLISNAVEQFLIFMRNPNHQKYGVCGGELLTGDDRETVSFGNFPNLFGIFSMFGLYLFFREKYQQKYLLGVVNYNDHIKEVDFISGAAMFIRKSAIELVGPFDPDFFLYFEETELSFRIAKTGLKSIILPYIKIIHLEGGSQISSKFNYIRYQNFAVSRQLFYQKSHSKFYAVVAKHLHLLHTLLFSLLGREKGNMWKKIKIIFNS
ncbi:glycosyltransferase family 2 protein [Pedobacter sp. Leaf250]|uniref:glycosyltransferase family 2 protein n=1 Tax=Pedobacter sp. Leaf250 TaxID=2876559 RepID=UPI001E6100AF|nr:glycosyltransferase family 2 protein [Pedobacter sp. Leaf250]